MWTVNNTLFDVQSSVSKHLHNGQNSSQSLRRCSPWVIILKFGSSKISHFFLRSADSSFIHRLQPRRYYKLSNIWLVTSVAKRSLIWNCGRRESFLSLTALCSSLLGCFSEPETIGMLHCMLYVAAIYYNSVLRRGNFEGTGHFPF